MKYAMISEAAYLYAIQSPRITGGNAKQEWLLAKALAQQGHDVALIVPSGEPLQADRLSGVRLVRSPAKWPAMLYAMQTLRAEKPDWFHIMGATPNLLPAVLIAHLSGIRTVWAFASDRQANPRTALVEKRSLWPLFALGLRAVDRIIAQHAGQRDSLAPSLRSKTYVVNNLIEAVAVEKPAKPYISWVGWLIRRKQPHLLVDIARALPEVTFVVAGPCEKAGDEADYGRDVVRQFESVPNIDYRGFVAREATQKIIADSTLFLSTSNHEGLPNTFLEAWIAGVPTLSLDLDPGEVMATYHTGVVVPSVAGVIASIEALLADPAQLGALGNNGKQYIHDHHSNEIVCKQLEMALNGQRERLQPTSEVAVSERM